MSPEVPGARIYMTIFFFDKLLAREGVGALLCNTELCIIDGELFVRFEVPCSTTDTIIIFVEDLNVAG